MSSRRAPQSEAAAHDESVQVSASASFESGAAESASAPSESAPRCSIEHRDVWTEGDRGGAHWDAWYPFSATGRRVHNRIRASFRFADGR